MWLHIGNKKEKRSERRCEIDDGLNHLPAICAAERGVNREIRKFSPDRFLRLLLRTSISHLRHHSRLIGKSFTRLSPNQSINLHSILPIFDVALTWTFSSWMDEKSFRDKKIFFFYGIPVDFPPSFHFQPTCQTSLGRRNVYSISANRRLVTEKQKNETIFGSQMIFSCFTSSTVVDDTQSISPSCSFNEQSRLKFMKNSSNKTKLKQLSDVRLKKRFFREKTCGKTFKTKSFHSANNFTVVFCL